MTNNDERHQSALMCGFVKKEKRDYCSWTDHMEFAGPSFTLHPHPHCHHVPQLKCGSYRLGRIQLNNTQKLILLTMIFRMFKDITPLLWGSNISILKSLKEQIVSASVVFFLGNCCLKTELLVELGGGGDGRRVWQGEHRPPVYSSAHSRPSQPLRWHLLFLINILIL